MLHDRLGDLHRRELFHRCHRGHRRSITRPDWSSTEPTTSTLFLHLTPHPSSTCSYADLTWCNLHPPPDPLSCKGDHHFSHQLFTHPLTMPRIVIIGGSGHIGSYLVPLLVAQHHEVINVSRGSAKPYSPHPAWSKVQQISLDRKDLENQGKFGTTIADLEADIIIDLITFDLPSAQQLVEALQTKRNSPNAGRVLSHYLFCSTIWVNGPAVALPISESDPAYPIDEYGKNKLLIEQYIIQQALSTGFPATSFRPGHIVGEGWNPINPQGNTDPSIFALIAKGKEELLLPNNGFELLHHVHAEDVARWIMTAINNGNRSKTIGECFNVVSPQALSMRGFAQEMYRYFGKEPKIAYKPMEEFVKTIKEKDENHGGASESHAGHSAAWSMEKSEKLLGFKPKWSSLEAVQEAVRALIRDGKISVH